MASQKQLKSWLKNALEKVESFRAEQAELDAKSSTLSHELATCQQNLLESENLVFKYQEALAKSKEGANCWPTSLVKMLDDWLHDRDVWNQDEWTHLLNMVLEKASPHQLQFWLNNAIERLEKFKSEQAKLEAEALKLSHKLSTCRKHLLETEDHVLRYQGGLDPSNTPIVLKDEKASEMGVNGWSTSFVKLLDNWLQGRSSWNHEEWTRLLNQILESEHAILAKTQTLEIGQYLESHRSLEGTSSL